ncbi:MAG: hypothetical protein M3O36_19405 [Myxococcota bacterium]|nr:hypothetical protein [Myxococcota bacterium]
MRRRRLRLLLSHRAARLLACATMALVAFVATPSAGRPPVSRFDSLPLASEQLARPIWLPHCKMRIVEWRSTSSLLGETTPSDQALTVLDDTCHDAFARYGDFLRSKKLPRLHLQPDLLPAMSLLPGNTLVDGKSPRALNDLPSRFKAVAPGCCYWGLYVDSLNHLFLRNDPLIKDESGRFAPNPRFVRTLTHEISHILSSRLGVWDAVGYDRQHDEDLAEEFVAYMGMRFPAESSSEDLAFHRGRLPYGIPPSNEVAGPVTPEGESPPPSASANTSPQR